MKKYTKEQRNKHLIIILILSALTFAITSMFNSGSTNLAGEFVDRKSVNSAALSTIFLTVPVVGFILGSLVALIPYGGLTYKQKYLRASLLTIIVIDSILLFNTIIQNLF